MLLSCLIRFLIYFCHWLVLAHLPVILVDYGLSDSQVGLLIALFAISAMALMAPLGFFADYFSPRRLLIVGALTYSLYFFGLERAQTLWPLLLLALLGGFGSACLVVVSEALYLKQYGDKDQGRRVAAFQVATYLGFGAGPFCGGLLLDYWSGDFFFRLAALVSLAIGLLCLGLADSSPIRFSFQRYRADMGQLRPLILMACVLLIGTHFGVEQTSSALLMRHIGLGQQEIGQIFGLLGLWMALCVPFVGWFKDRRDSFFVFLLVGIAISGFFQLITGLAEGYWSYAVIRLCHTLGDTIALLELGVLLALLFPVARLGGNSGLLYGLRTLATFGAAIGAGLINQSFGYAATFLISGTLMLLFAALMTLYILTSRERCREVGWRP